MVLNSQKRPRNHAATLNTKEQGYYSHDTKEMSGLQYSKLKLLLRSFSKEKCLHNNKSCYKIENEHIFLVTS